MVTVVPLLGLAGILARQGRINSRHLGLDLVLLGLLILVLYPDRDLPMVYHLFSGCVALVCYRVVSLNCYPPGSTEVGGVRSIPRW
jgi:hypothetical protein